jgi:hypothetical protein
MALDPNIALGVRGIEIVNPLAQYGQISQIQNAQNQNALAQYQLATAQREQESVNALNQAYAKAYDPQTGEVDINTLRKTLSTGGFGSKLPGIEKSLGELEKQKLEALKLKGEVTAQPTKLEAEKSNLIDAKLKQSRSLLDTINPLDPSAPAAYIAWHEANHKDPVIGPLLESRGVTVDQSRARIENAISQGPQAFADLLNASKLGTEKFMELNKPSTFAQDTGVGGRLMTRPGLGGVATIVPGSEFTKGKTFADITAERNANLSASRFAFDQNKFAWEKANPGFELKEAEDGSIVGVNKRTLQAFPVTIGGVAPVAPTAPVASAGMPGARLPEPAGQAIPGMTSVLDQQAPTTASTVGKPLMGKGQNLTESQSNATAYGMRMKEANAILDTMAKQGTLRGANIEAVPLVGEGLGKVLPSVLGGTSGAQQQVNQAKSNFITAVLRKESGAVISDSEFDREDKKYFPQVNDNPAVIKQKENARKLAIKAMEIQAGPGAKNIQQLQPSVGGGVDTSNPLLR